MIQIENLCKSFGEKVLFQGYDLEIESGEFLIFTGVSGCGKTTLLNMIGALEPLDAGRILVDGIDIANRHNKMQYFRAKAGFLFQNFALIEDKTVSENMKIVRKNNRSEITVEDALHRVGLESKKNHKIYTLSGGEQQRIALARLMIKKCDLILADEPTGSLDRENATEVMRILSELNQEGKTVLVVTHDKEITKFGRRMIGL